MVLNFSSLVSRSFTASSAIFSKEKSFHIYKIDVSESNVTIKPGNSLTKTVNSERSITPPRMKRVSIWRAAIKKNIRASGMVLQSFQYQKAAKAIRHAARRIGIEKTSTGSGSTVQKYPVSKKRTAREMEMLRICLRDTLYLTKKLFFQF